MRPRIVPIARAPLDASVRVPGSKSLTHRALVAAALADGRSEIVAPLDSDDTVTTADGLAALGCPVARDRDVWLVDGRGGAVTGGGRIELRQSGTSMRVLAAVAALGRVPSVLDGHPRLRERPMREQYEALRAIGAYVEAPGEGRGLPARIGGTPLLGGTVRVEGGRSSQFASALLLIGPRLPGGIEIEIVPPAVSLPYVALTVDTLREFGVAVTVEGWRYRVEPGGYPGRRLRVEGDHSAASCLLAAAAVAGGRVRVDGIRPESAQPDARMTNLLRRLDVTCATGPDWIEARGTGRIPGFEVDLGEAPDLAPAVALLGLFADGASRIAGVAHLRYKESDRIERIVEGVRALGRSARSAGDAIEIGGRPGPGDLRGAPIRTAGDHRIAMAFAVAGLRIPGVGIDDAGCVAKSFPRFWEVLDELSGRRRSA